jgi:C-terminal processing protease CtpA/Prc
MEAYDATRSARGTDLTREPCPYRKFYPAWIRIVGQNHRIIASDVGDPARARYVCRRPAQAAVRLTTARYYTPSGRSIQAKGIEPDVVVEEELPDDLKKKADELSTRGEANLRGHLKIEGVDGAQEASQEETGSSSYVAPDKAKDTQLNYALDLLRGIKSVDTETKKKAEAN